MDPLDKGTHEHYQNFSQVEAIPNSTTVLVLGILSILLAGILGLILGIIALNLSRSGRTAYEANPSRYTKASLSNLNGGRVCAIIGVSISALVILIAIIIVAS